MKYFRLSSHSYIRSIYGMGYIQSNLTKHDRVYNESGQVFLETINRIPSLFEEGLRHIMTIYPNIPKKKLAADYQEFLENLARDHYIVLANKIEDLAKNELRFSYKLENPKILIEDFLKKNRDNEVGESQQQLGDAFRKKPFIFSFQIEVTSRCNERCIHCYIPHPKKTTDIKPSLFYSVLDQLSEMGTLGLTLSGGECFLHPQIGDFLRYARKKDFNISVLSNVTVLTKKLIQLLHEINICLIQVSVYSMVPDIHDAITLVQGSFKKTMKNIKALVDADVPVQISCPVMKLNREGYKDVLAWANRLKMKAITDYIMMGRSDGTTDNLAQRIDIEETGVLLLDIINFDKDYISRFNSIIPPSQNFRKWVKEPICGVALDNSCMDANGNIYPCSGWQGYKVGNANEMSIKEIWEESPQLNYLRSITHAHFPQCRGCKAVDYCAMCLVRNFNESGGDLLKVNDHFCQSAHLNKKLVDNYLKDRPRMKAKGR